MAILWDLVVAPSFLRADSQCRYTLLGLTPQSSAIFSTRSPAASRSSTSRSFGARPEIATMLTWRLILTYAPAPPCPRRGGQIKPSSPIGSLTKKSSARIESAKNSDQRIPDHRASRLVFLVLRAASAPTQPRMRPQLAAPLLVQVSRIRRVFLYPVRGCVLERCPSSSSVSKQITT